MEKKELSIFMAEKVMGWTWIDRLHCKDQSGKHVIDGIEWQPTENHE